MRLGCKIRMGSAISKDNQQLADLLKNLEIGETESESYQIFCIDHMVDNMVQPAVYAFMLSDYSLYQLELGKLSFND